MNFLKINLDVKQYHKIINFKSKIIDKKFILENYGLFLGNKSFYRLIKCYELLKEVKNIKGDIIEFGVWNGNNLFSLKKISDYLKTKKKIIGIDNFSGLPNPTKKKMPAKYVGNKRLIKFIKNFFNFNSVDIIDDDIMNLHNHRTKIGKISFAYIDCDIYQVAKKILNEIHPKISLGGIIVFDEGNRGNNKGEGKAIKDFLYLHKRKYTKEILLKNYQPDVVLRKVRL